jgi:hypothetical protein
MTEDQKALLQTYLAEYSSLRQEITTRLQALHQAVNFILIIIGAAVTAILAASQHGMIETVSIILALFLPIVVAPLAFIFFDQEITMDAIWSYIQMNLRPRIIAVVGDSNILGNIWEFRYMHHSSWKIYHRLLIGRWLLFLIPTLLPLIYFVAYTAAKWNWWHNYVIWGTAVDAYVLTAFCGVIVSIDALVTYHLIRTIVWTFRKWDSPGGEPAPHPATSASPQAG